MTDDRSNQAVSIEELKPKTRLQGRIKAVGLHGAVVDIGLPYEGLLHISQLSGDREVDAVAEAVRVGDEVTVWIADVQPDEKRVSLTMVEPPDLTWEELQEGKVYSGEVTRIEQYGVFVDIGAKRPGLLHVREMSSGYVEHPSNLVSVGDQIDVRLQKLDRRRQRIDLTRQGLEEETTQEREPEEVDEEEETLEQQTAMEAALERAYADRGQGDAEDRRPKRRRQEDAEQAEILERTLEQHSGQE